MKVSQVTEERKRETGQGEEKRDKQTYKERKDNGPFRDTVG